MSDKLPQDSTNEEVDLGQLFNAIGKLFEKLFAFIGKIFKGLFTFIIYSLKPIVNNFKLLAIVLMLAAIVGFLVEKYSKAVFKSDMLVKPYFESKYQLDNNINYFNALISSQNYLQLSNIFEIDTTVAKELIGFELTIGPETQNDLLKEYDDYIKSIDSTLAAEVTYEQFIDNRDILSGTVFSIQAYASKKDIFSNLEKGFIKTFENEYSKKLKRIRDSALIINKETYLKELQKTDSLQKIYLSIKKSESEKGEVVIGAKGFLPFMQQKTTTNEYELFQEELLIRNKIREIDEQLIEESDYYDILSSFEEVGTRHTLFYQKYSVIFPILAFLVMLLGYFSLKFFKFIKEYE
ncbi:hypothetical protein BWZ20_09215 [Winogradskyella sp. J14-2]|uniref:hypothetical protein n=1 Tax=Winogradskyella sp. J14-2 TaxID=1936080 RepID=UPI000972E971|nr:hypothetical protein [Winogradskyella sp. J14-2]APY08465.1 hypothetical protein BWZ20_09215 [Winogradskyella sp. J14-2]